MPLPPRPVPIQKSAAFLLFLWVLLIHVLLSYAPFPFQVKFWLFLIGWGGVLAVWRFHPGLPEKTDQEIVPWPAWLAFLVVASALGMRILWPANFLTWPLYDEMINGYYAMRLNQHWDWHPFFFWTQLPPLLIWLLAFLFKILPSTLNAIRVLPILISLAILPVAYHSIRRFFPRSTAWLFLAFLSTGFGFLYFGRICHQSLLLLLFEFLAFDALGGYLKASSSTLRSIWLGVCGIVIGAGFYTYFSWPVVGLAMTLPILVRIYRLPSRREKAAQLLLFGLPLMVVLLPLLFALWERNFGSYYSFMIAFNPSRDSFSSYLLRVSETLSGIFWGYPHDEFFYGPVWGGLFNPVSGGLMLLGCFWQSQKMSRERALWFWGAVTLFLAPGILSGPPLNELRIIQFLPLGAFSAVQCLEFLLIQLPMKNRLFVLLVFLALSTGLDFIHLQKTKDYLGAYFKNQKTAEYPIAYPILEKEYQANGRGIILFNLTMPVFPDYSLRMACFPFNAADVPRPKETPPTWVGFICNIHFRPFLEREFPEGQWFWLSKDLAPETNCYTGGFMLGLIPITDRNRARLEAWEEFNHRMDAVFQPFMIDPIGPAKEKAMEKMDQMASSLDPDPFLQSCYWDMVFCLHNYGNGIGISIAQNREILFSALNNALRKGYPAAYFYNELGSLYVFDQNYGKARDAFNAAIRSPLNLTPAQFNLEMLKQVETKSSSHSTGSPVSDSH